MEGSDRRPPRVHPRLLAQCLHVRTFLRALPREIPQRGRRVLARARGEQRPRDVEMPPPRGAVQRRLAVAVDRAHDAVDAAAPRPRRGVDQQRHDVVEPARGRVVQRRAVVAVSCGRRRAAREQQPRARGVAVQARQVKRGVAVRALGLDFAQGRGREERRERVGVAQLARV
eukprot:30896-Pelagococcus_subviridis.AAC.3